MFRAWLPSLLLHLPESWDLTCTHKTRDGPELFCPIVSHMSSQNKHCVLQIPTSDSMVISSICNRNICLYLKLMSPLFESWMRNWWQMPPCVCHLYVIIFTEQIQIYSDLTPPYSKYSTELKVRQHCIWYLLNKSHDPGWHVYFTQTVLYSARSIATAYAQKQFSMNILFKGAQ